MLYIIATPIGNLDDFTPRALQALRSADVLACEDTRRTRGLMSHFDVPRPPVVISYRQGKEQAAGRRLLALLGEGKSVALCSDGGYPGISDPGYRIIRAAIEAGHEVSVLPGASAVTVALLSSGLPTSSYCFKGYPPRKQGPLLRFFEDEKERPHTLIIYESPYRVLKSLQAAFEVLGDRQAAVCRELTKEFEQVSRGYLSELVAEFEGVNVRGEIAIVIAGNNPKFARQAGKGR